jgi:hypothetical protein
VSGLRPEILEALAKQRVKQIALDLTRPLVVKRASEAIPWWAWTVWLAYGIAAKRLQEA